MGIGDGVNGSNNPHDNGRRSVDSGIVGVAIHGTPFTLESSLEEDSRDGQPEDEFLCFFYATASGEKGVFSLDWWRGNKKIP